MATSNQVKGWILEYAIKYGLDSIMQQFQNKMKSTHEKKCGTSPPQQSVPEDGLPTVFILLWFLRSTHIDDPLQFENMVKLKYLLVVLQKLFVWCDTISLDAFWSLHTKIKLMVILQSLHQESATSELVNGYFPPWSNNYEEKLMLKYRIKEKSALELIRRDHENCRLFLFHLMISRNNLLAYYKKFLVYEWDNYVGELKELFAGFLDAVASMLPTTKVEHIVLGNISKELSESSSPAAGILLNSLKSSTGQLVSIEKALQKALLDLDVVTIECSTQPHSQKSPVNSADCVIQKSPANSTDLTSDFICQIADNAESAKPESPIPPCSPEIDVVDISPTSEDEPVPSTSSGITHTNRKRRRMDAMPPRRHMVKRPLVFYNQYGLLSSSNDDSS